MHDTAYNDSSYYRCYLGLGSNITNELGTPEQHINHAIHSLTEHDAISHVRASSLYVSAPLGPQDQPDFINAVVEIDTVLTPHQLLELCQQLEHDAGRVRLRRWGERSLDVDILLYADKQLSSEVLTIPHRGIKERNFVLIPLKQLNPSLVIDDVTISELDLANDWQDLHKLP